jgi:hypothetical protein
MHAWGRQAGAALHRIGKEVITSRHIRQTLNLALPSPSKSPTLQPFSLFHSSATFPCPAQIAALPRAGAVPVPGVLSVGLMNDGLNTVLAVDKAGHRMRVGAGMDLNRLFQVATDNGMSVQVGAGMGAGSWGCGGKKVGGAGLLICW